MIFNYQKLCVAADAYAVPYSGVHVVDPARLKLHAFKRVSNLKRRAAAEQNKNLIGQKMTFRRKA